jgi:hypothetical protein
MNGNAGLKAAAQVNRARGCPEVETRSRLLRSAVASASYSVTDKCALPLTRMIVVSACSVQAHNTSKRNKMKLIGEGFDFIVLPSRTKHDYYLLSPTSP